MIIAAYLISQVVGSIKLAAQGSYLHAETTDNFTRLTPQFCYYFYCTVFECIITPR